MKDIRLTQEQKIMIAVFVAILVLLCIGGYIIIINSTHQQSATTPQILAVPTTENIPTSSAKIFFPVIAFEISTEQVEPRSLSELLPTETPANLWMVTKIYTQSYSFRGYVYDLGVFENVSTGENIKAFCADPGWPAPNLGDLFIRNDWNVLVSINNDKPPWTQHFIVIDN
ncbi:MAG TPA: hypothetical protein VF326_00620 [Anaerolineaceae bacterium]|jgi:hypothetical protein